MRENFCVLPWLHAATTPSGALRLCCRTEAFPPIDGGEAPSLARAPLSELWNATPYREARRRILDDKRLPACAACWREEALGKRSKRLAENEKWAREAEEILGRTGADGEAPDAIYLDLRLGNRCNLRCRTCSPEYSSSLERETAALVGAGADLPRSTLANLASARDAPWWERPGFWEELRARSPRLREIYLTGGEPTLIPELVEFVEYCAREGIAKNIGLRFNTNATHAPERWLAALPAFASVHAGISVDGPPAVNEYIRFPAKTAAIEASLARYAALPDHVEVCVNATVSLLNVLRLPELADWLDGVQRGHEKKIGLLVNLLHFPVFLRPNLLPSPWKERAVALLEAERAKPRGFAAEAYHRDLPGLLAALAVRPRDPATAIREFLAQTRAQDAYRNDSLTGKLPEFENILRSWSAVERSLACE